MTDLEFIEQFIKGTELTLNTYIQLQTEELSHPDIYDKSIEITKKELQHLQQIKAELEALKLIKDKLILSIKKETNCFDEQDITGCWLVQGDIVKCYTIIELNEYQTLKKALEVEDDK